jgi:predicted PurR-regulated permease PerM
MEMWTFSLPHNIAEPGIFLAAVRAIEGGSSFLLSVLLLLAVLAGVQNIQDGLIVPQVMRSAIGLRPVAILPGLFIWGKLLGFPELLLYWPSP